MRRTSLALLVLTAVACGPKHGPGSAGTSSPALAAYAGLRWVPADATYAVVARRTEDAVAVTRHLIEALGIAGEFDVAEVSRESTRELGVDLLSSDGLAGLGIDVGRGAAVWSRGLGPSVALPLADPERFTAEIDRRRGEGVVIQVGRVGELDVHTYRPGRDAALHWTIAGDWFLAHLEVVDEREADGAWIADALAARGALAAHPDFVAALDEGRGRLGGEPPVVALARVPAILQHPLVGAPPGCAGTLGKLGRVFVAAGVEGGDARGAIVAELPGGVDGVRALVQPIPAGWSQARDGAPLAAEVGFDLQAAARALAPCLGDDVTELARAPVRSGRLFAHQVDLARREGKGAVAVELVDPGLVDEAMGEIPGLGLLSKKRTVSGVDVTDVNVPGVPAISIGVKGASAVVATAGLFDAVLAGGMVAGGDELARVVLLPQAWPAETWDQLLAQVMGRDEARADTVRRLRAWSRGEIVVSLQGRALVLTAHGTR